MFSVMLIGQEICRDPNRQKTVLSASADLDFAPGGLDSI
jgi:hypothetical protein